MRWKPLWSEEVGPCWALLWMRPVSPGGSSKDDQRVGNRATTHIHSAHSTGCLGPMCLSGLHFERDYILLVYDINYFTSAFSILWCLVSVYFWSSKLQCLSYLHTTVFKCEKEKRWPTGIPPALCAAEVTRITPLKSLLIMVALKLFAFPPVGNGKLTWTWLVSRD